MKNLCPIVLMLALCFGCSDNIEPIILDTGPTSGTGQIPNEGIPNGRRYVGPQEVPEVMDAIEGRFGKLGPTGKAAGTQWLVVDTQYIIEVPGRGGRTNYTLGLYMDGQAEGEFYNLVVPVDSLGSAGGPFVRHYQVYGHALAAFLGSGHDFRHFQGTYRDWPADIFLRATEGGKGMGSLTEAGGDCGGDGGTVGGGGAPTINQDLIDLGDDSDWPDGTGYGYTRALGPWNDHGGSGGYDLTVQLHDVPQGRNELAQVPALEQGLVSINTGGIVARGIENTATYVNITTHVPQEGSGVSCSTTVTIKIDGFYSVETHYYDCGGPPVQQKGAPAMGAKDCGGDEDLGDIAVLTPKQLHLVGSMLGFAAGSAEHQWLAAPGNGDRGMQLKAFLDDNKIAPLEVAPEAKAFGREAVHAWMGGGGVDFEERIIYNLENGCVKIIVETVNTMNMGLANDMQNAFGVSSDYDLIYKQTDLVDYGNMKTLGQTDVTLRNNGKIENITISLDSGFLNSGTDIAIFSIIIHENMHALMFYQLDMLEIAPDNPNIDLSILADQWSQVVAESSGGQLPPNELAYTQHEIMSNLIATVAGYIMDFASDKGYNMNITQAEALAWIGLDDSVAWTIMDQNLKDTYINIIDYEISSFEILAVGTKCD